MNQCRVAHGVITNNDYIHVIGGSASAGDVTSFGVGMKGLEVFNMGKLVVSEKIYLPRNHYVAASFICEVFISMYRYVDGIC